MTELSSEILELCNRISWLSAPVQETVHVLIEFSEEL